MYLLVQANSSDWSTQSGIPSQCFPSGTQLASDQQVNCVGRHPADNDRVLAPVTDVDSLWIVLMVVVVVVIVDGRRRPSSTSTPLEPYTLDYITYT